MQTRTEKKARLLTQSGRFSFEKALDASPFHRPEDVVDTGIPMIWQTLPGWEGSTERKQAKYAQHEDDPIPVSRPLIHQEGSLDLS